MNPGLEETFRSGLDALFGELALVQPHLGRGEDAGPVLSRLLHSIKSLAGAGGQDTLEREAHRLEDLLAAGDMSRLAEGLAVFASFRNDASPALLPPVAGDPYFRSLAWTGWDLQGRALEQAWTQWYRNGGLWCLSAWVECPGESAWLRARMLLASLETEYPVLDAWGAGQDGRLRNLQRDADILSDDPVVTVRFLLAGTGRRMPDPAASMPDQVTGWICTRIPPSILDKPMAGLEGHMVALMRRASPETACPGAFLSGRTGGRTLSRSLESLIRGLQSRQQVALRTFLSVQDPVVPPRVLVLLEEALVQLIRNTLSHGIETPEVRAAAWKPPLMGLWLFVQHHQDDIVVLLQDDGAGFGSDDPLDDVVVDNDVAEPGCLHSARSLGEVRQDWTDTLPPRGLPGAGLASGRGVGLASAAFIVETLLQGRMECRGSLGHGTAFVMTIPSALIQAECDIFTTSGGLMAIPRGQLVCDGEGPLRIPAGDDPDRVWWAGVWHPVMNPAPLLELQAAGASAVVAREGGKAFWVGSWLGGESAVFPRNGNAFHSLRAGGWVEILDME